MKALPERLCISIGGYFGPCYDVTLKKGRLTYTYSSGPSSAQKEQRDVVNPELRRLMGLKPLPQPEEIQPSARQWQTFRRALDRLNVWSWKRKYLDPHVCDGVGWSVKIAYSDRSLVSGGSNGFPGRDGRAISSRADGTDKTFAKFCRAVARLVGREFQ